jgi:hypothetical protein
VSGADIYSQSGAQLQDIFLLILHRKFIRAPDSSIVRVCGPRSGIQVQEQLHSIDVDSLQQSKLATPRRENRKIRYKIKILKAKEHTS